MSNTICSIDGVKFDCGQGRYSPLTGEFAQDLARYVRGIEPEIAVAAGKVLAAEVGRLKAQIGMKDIKAGKTKKEGGATIREIANSLANGDLHTPSLKALRMVQVINTLEYIQRRPTVLPVQEIVDWLDNLKPAEPLFENDDKGEKAKAWQEKWTKILDERNKTQKDKEVTTSK